MPFIDCAIDSYMGLSQGERTAPRQWSLGLEHSRSEHSLDVLFFKKDSISAKGWSTLSHTLAHIYKHPSSGGRWNGKTWVAIHFCISPDKLVSLCVFAVAWKCHLLDSLGSIRAGNRKKQPVAMLLTLSKIYDIPTSISLLLRFLSCLHHI